MKKHIELYAQWAYTKSQPMNLDPYAENRTTLYLDPKLVEISKKHFRKTRYRSLSGFVESQIRKELRRQSPKLKKQGAKLPASLFREEQ